MTRVSKSPEERKGEIISAAIRLFNENGVENTNISDIVKSIGAAQGTFYYYFKSKEDVIDTIILRRIKECAKRVDNIMDQDIDIKLKTKAIVKEVISMSMLENDSIKEYIREKRYFAINPDITEKIIKLIGSKFSKLIEMGNKEGIFHTEYNELTAITLFMLWGSIFQRKVSECKDDPDILDFLVYISEKILGCKKGELSNFIDIGDITALMNEKENKIEVKK